MSYCEPINVLNSHNRGNPCNFSKITHIPQHCFIGFLEITICQVICTSTFIHSHHEGYYQEIHVWKQLFRIKFYGSYKYARTHSLWWKFSTSGAFILTVFPATAVHTVIQKEVPFLFMKLNKIITGGNSMNVQN